MGLLPPGAMCAQPRTMWGRGSPWSLQLQVLPTMIRDVGSEVFKALSVLCEASVGFNLSEWLLEIPSDPSFTDPVPRTIPSLRWHLAF